MKLNPYNKKQNIFTLVLIIIVVGLFGTFLGGVVYSISTRNYIKNYMTECALFLSGNVKIYGEVENVNVELGSENIEYLGKTLVSGQFQRKSKDEPGADKLVLYSVDQDTKTALLNTWVATPDSELFSLSISIQFKTYLLE